MELIQVANYMNGRYLLSNIKSDKKALLSGELLASYSVDFFGKFKKEKIYYDTPDFFFADKGVNIYTVVEGDNRELIIRYDSEQVKRIEFLKNIPSFFKVKIEKNSSILNYSEQINEAIYKLFPDGLHINIDDMLRECTPQIRILKKCEQYRVVNNKGLKSTLSFDDVTYINIKTRKKFSQQTLDIMGSSIKSKEDFVQFLKLIVLDYPKLIRIENNELTVARNNLN